MGSGYGGKYKNTYGYREHLKTETVFYVKEGEIPYGVARTTIEENAKLVKEKYGLDENGMFCQSTKRAQVYKSKTPVEDSIEFYEKLGTGGKKEELPNGHGTRTTLSDKTVITHRIITSTPDSPAVDINIQSPSFIKSQKIHFVLERE